MATCNAAAINITHARPVTSVEQHRADARPLDDGYDTLMARLKDLVVERNNHGLLRQETDQQVRLARADLVTDVLRSPCNNYLTPKQRDRYEHIPMGRSQTEDFPLAQFPHIPDAPDLLEESVLNLPPSPRPGGGGGDNGPGDGGTGGGNTGTGGGGGGGTGRGNTGTGRDDGQPWEEVGPRNRRGGGRGRRQTLPANVRPEMPSRSGQPWDSSLGGLETEDLVDRGAWWDTGVRSRRILEDIHSPADHFIEDDYDDEFMPLFEDDDEDMHPDPIDLASMGIPCADENTTSK